MVRIFSAELAATALLLFQALLCLSSPLTRAQAAEIVARIDGEIITERDVTNRSVFLQNKLKTLAPALRLTNENLEDFALDLLLQEALQRHHLVAERALPVANAALAKRIALLQAQGGGKAGGKAEQSFWKKFARLELEWEGYVGRVAEFNNPVTPQEALEERAHLSASAAKNETRYRLEEIFLPRLEGGEATRKIAEALYRVLRRRADSFALLQSLLPAPYTREGDTKRIFYKSALPTPVLEALEQGKVGANGIVAPVGSPYGVHLYRVLQQRSDKKTTRYSFIQTVFWRIGYGEKQAAILSDSAFCEAPQEASLSLAAYDLQVIEDVPQQDLPPDIAQILSDISVGLTTGPFPFAQGLIAFVTLCNRWQAAERGDTFEEMNHTLRLRRVRALSKRLVESLRTRAAIETKKQALTSLEARAKRNAGESLPSLQNPSLQNP